MGGSVSGKSSNCWQRLSCEISVSQLLVTAWLTIGCIVAGSLTASGQTPASVGQFSSVTTWPYQAVHAQLLPTGKVLWWPSFENGDNPTLWDPATNTNTAITQAGANIFCAGHAFLPAGRLLVAGGHAGTYLGLPNAYIFSYLNNSWTRLPDMN